MHGSDCVRQIQAPVLFPPMDLPAALQILDEDVDLVAKQRQLAADMTKSPYYISPQDGVMDVERYADGIQATVKRNLPLASQLSPAVRGHLPPELLDHPRAARGGSPLPDLKPLPAFDAKSLTVLEDRERKSAEAGGDKEKDKDRIEALSDVDAEADEEEQDDDYAVDHYESGAESDGNDEPAAMF